MRNSWEYALDLASTGKKYSDMSIEQLNSDIVQIEAYRMASFDDEEIEDMHDRIECMKDVLIEKLMAYYKKMKGGNDAT
jgi:hypothetical protein